MSPLLHGFGTLDNYAISVKVCMAIHELLDNFKIKYIETAKFEETQISYRENYHGCTVSLFSYFEFSIII